MLRPCLSLSRPCGLAWLLLPLGALGAIAAAVLMVGHFGGSRAGAPSASIAFVEQVIMVDSPALNRSLPATVYLPPGYEAGDQRYPVLYMLHGLGATRDEWQEYGMFEVAVEMMRSGEIPPFIIVLPEGEDGYWFNHAFNGPRWGDYLARDVVNAIDARYRTLSSRDFRAVGGLSMGADGALQIALNNPDVFGVVQAHGPVLRPFDIASPYYGDIEYFNANYPVTLVEQKPEVARSLKIQLDVGDVDLWLWSATAFHDQLTALEIPHEWYVWSGGHDYAYWIRNIPQNLRTMGSVVRAALAQSP
ncbi:MAG TPA: alpha/beta hydrolase-fold protein [Dehalococcoidia bacterium]|nr:alpha/beta hydrolase-fold protein [Dehalococcoidia bacterium]